MDEFNSLNIPEDYSDNQRDIIESCKEKLIQTSSFDLPLLLSCHMKNNDKLKILMDQYYKIHSQLSFSNIVDQALKATTIPNRVIYTYTQIYDKIEYLNYNNLLMEIKIGSFKSEFELRAKIEEYYQLKNSRLLFIRVDYHYEHKHLLFLKHLIQNESIESRDHGIWLVLHLQRNLMDKIQDDVLFNGWSPLMIDNLNKKKLMQIEVLTNPSYPNLLDHADFSLSHTMFNELVTQSFVRVRYTVRCKNKEGLINQRRDSIFDLLTLGSIDTESLNKVIKTHLIELIKTADLDYVRSEPKDWRQDLLNNPTIAGSCRSIDSALQMTLLLFYCNYFLMFLVEAEKSSLFDSCCFLISKRNNDIYEKLKTIWFSCLRSVFQSIPRTITIMDTVEISLIFDLRLPCVQLEYQIIRQIYEMVKNDDEDFDAKLSEDKLLDLAMEKLRNTSIYGETIQNILDDTNLFEHYFHDQIAILLDELGINHLSVLFAQKLLTINPTLTVENKMKYFLVDQDELIKLLNLFEIGLEIIGEDKWEFDEQFRKFTETEAITFNNSTNLYVLIQVGQQFYQVPPQESFDSNRIYECNSDPFIETSLMNLIELLVSSSVIERADNIVQLSTAFSLTDQSILALDNYEIYNLEKLRSFESLVRCVMDLLPNDEALFVFKNICLNSHNNTIFNGTFPTCNDISKFMRILTKRINTNSKCSIDSFTCRPLLKLEVEFLKNWLIDHGDEYCTVLDSIYKSKRNFWLYSAKIFKYIDQKLDLMSIVQTRFDEISSIEELRNLDEYFSQSNNDIQKIQRIMINRINTHLLNCVENENIFESYLANYYDMFQKNIHAYPFNCGFSMIVSIAWLKAYLQIYSFSLSKDSRAPVMKDIDKLLTNTASAFCSTLKIFIMKSFCQIYRVDLEGLYETFFNRNCAWIKAVFLRYEYRQQRKSNQNIILPVPLFQAEEEYMNIDNVLKDDTPMEQWITFIDKCSTNQQSSYCFIMFFVHQYAKFHRNFASSAIFKNVMENYRMELTERFEPIGYKLLLLLCNNFHDNSYFRLNEAMTQDQLHRRLLALNIAALFLSCKADQKVTLFSNILFDERRKMPQNYKDYLQTICLPGFISDDQNHTDQQNNAPRFGYHSMKSTRTSKIDEKPNHLKLSISYRFIHMIIHAVLLVLHELGLLDNSYQPNRDYCRDHFEKDYELISQLLTEPDQCYIWLYKMINHIVGDNYEQDSSLEHNERVIEFEKSIENKLIIPHIESIINEIREYKLAYNKFLKRHNIHLTLHELIDELVDDENECPLLSFFNMTNNHIVNPIDSFYAKLRILPDADKIYPTTMLFLKQSDDYENIRYLHPIITFINYLNQKFNYRITRKNAEKKTINEVLFKDSDKTMVLKVYNDFIEAWYQISLKEVCLDSEKIKFEHKYPSEEFKQRTEIAKLFINSSKDPNSLLLIACIKTISNLQNKIVEQFYEIMNSNTTGKRVHPSVVPLQSLQPKHLLCLNKDMINRKLLDDASVVNYEYGMGKDIIYDFEEIEFMIREKISCLPLIDTDRLQFLNYQFELYEENASLITDVRRNSEQKLLPEKKRNELQKLIDTISNDDIINYLGSLDQIFTYIRHCERKSMRTLTIKTFIEQHVRSKMSLTDKLFQDSNLSTIDLVYIVDFYQLLEEIAFEKILRNHIEKDLRGSLLLSVDEESYRMDQFIEMTTGNIAIAPCLKNLDCWINMLKRLLLRVSSNINLSFDVPLQQFATRSDFWPVDVTANDIQSFKIADDILLRHAFIILKSLEERKADPQSERRSHTINERSNIGSSNATQHIWFQNLTAIRNQREVTSTNSKSNKKIRV